MKENNPPKDIVALPTQNPPALKALLQGPPQLEPPPRLPDILKNSRTQHLTQAVCNWADENETEIQLEYEERLRFGIENLEKKAQGSRFIPRTYTYGSLHQRRGEVGAKLHLIDKYLTKARHDYDFALADFNSKLHKWCSKGGDTRKMRTGISLPGRTLRSHKPDLYNGPARYGPNSCSLKLLETAKNNMMKEALRKLAFENKPGSYNIGFLSLSPLKDLHNNPPPGLTLVQTGHGTGSLTMSHPSGSPPSPTGLPKRNPCPPRSPRGSKGSSLSKDLKTPITDNSPRPDNNTSPGI